MPRPSRVALLGLVVPLALVACSRPETITSCEQSLEGAWHSDHAGERWMILERDDALEVYPLFPDGRPLGTPADLETAPRVIDLARAPRGLGGDVKRRFTQRGVACLAKAAVHVTSCADDVLELVLADPPPPPGSPRARSPAPTPRAASAGAASESRSARRLTM